MLTSNWRTREAGLPALFQSIKGEASDLKNLADSLETHLFEKWITVNNIYPDDLAVLLKIKVGNALLKSDPRYITLEAYTLQFAECRGRKSALEKVKKLFVNNDPSTALTAAAKVE